MTETPTHDTLQRREEIRAALAPFLGGSTRLNEATDAILSLLPWSLPVEVSEERKWALSDLKLVGDTIIHQVANDVQHLVARDVDHHYAEHIMWAIQRAIDAHPVKAPIEMRAMLDRIDKLEAVAAAVSPVLQEADRDTVNFNRLRTAIKALEARDD
jgi:hypothetical protein